MNSEEKKKTPDYIKRANDVYRRKHDTITIILQAGTKDRIKAHIGPEGSINAYIGGLIYNDLENSHGNGASGPDLNDPENIPFTR